jgi:hypothetical protein
MGVAKHRAHDRDADKPCQGKPGVVASDIPSADDQHKHHNDDSLGDLRKPAPKNWLIEMPDPPSIAERHADEDNEQDEDEDGQDLFPLLDRPFSVTRISAVQRE